MYRRLFNKKLLPPLFVLVYFVIVTLLIACHFFLLMPYLQKTALDERYSRFGVNWLIPSNDVDNVSSSTDQQRRQQTLVSPSLITYIRERYKRTDPETGSVELLDCTAPNRPNGAYVHVFRATSNGKGLAISVRPSPHNDDQWIVVDSLPIAWSHQKHLRLRRYNFNCVDRVADWRNVMTPIAKQRNVSSERKRLVSNSYRVIFRNRQGADETKPVPGSYPVFLFNDKYEFPFEQYELSLITGVRSPFNDKYDDNGSRLEDKLPPLWLTRRRSVDHPSGYGEQVSFLKNPDLSLELFRGKVSTLTAQKILNPCWNDKLGQTVTGLYPVTASQYSSIYLRGLQTIHDVSDDANAEIALTRMYWRCFYDIDNRTNQEGDANTNLLQVVKKATKRNGDNVSERPTVNLASILGPCMLQLLLCLNETDRFDPKTKRCVPRSLLTLTR